MKDFHEEDLSVTPWKIGSGTTAHQGRET